VQHCGSCRQVQLGVSLFVNHILHLCLLVAYLILASIFFGAGVF
jgi:hypothetical protein